MAYKEFSPKGKDFCLSFTKHECYFAKCNICPIDENVEWKAEMSVPKFRNDKYYCPHLFYSMKTNGFTTESRMDEIEIEYDSASGAYAVNEGRHRVCVAQKTGIRISAWMSER